MRNIKLTIEYDGKEFNGWQKQPNKLNIQGNIERAIETITGEKVDLNASGRTDAGVHAIAQVANFKTNSTLPIEKWPLAFELLNNCGGDNHEGFIGLQDHGDDVWFRNIRVKVLD